MFSCGADASGVASDPYDTPVTSTSKKMWTGGDRGSPLMHPSDACISCHSRGEGPTFAFAGTLYPSAHEPTDCNGSSASGANVIITDARGSDHTLTPNAAGNFYLSGSFKKPYSAKLVYQGRTGPWSPSGVTATAMAATRSRATMVPPVASCSRAPERLGRMRRVYVATQRSTHLGNHAALIVSAQA
ncbi:MAG: hypothetical protein JWN04_6644 [Myxococcaceae bacterium]|nr:hypothetical protein [Myxococcaceae bacterium]